MIASDRHAGEIVVGYPVAVVVDPVARRVLPLDGNAGLAGIDDPSVDTQQRPGRSAAARSRSRLVRTVSRLYYGLARLWPGMFAYQNILEAEIITLDEESTWS